MNLTNPKSLSKEAIEKTTEAKIQKIKTKADLSALYKDKTISLVRAEKEKALQRVWIFYPCPVFIIEAIFISQSNIYINMNGVIPQYIISFSFVKI